jgi:glycosyltransferase involved in cell wall biosynthesis
LRILHWVKREKSGLFKTTLELAKYEERQGHQISLRTPSDNKLIYGFAGDDFDIQCIHSQINPMYYKDGKPKILFLHGEPNYGILNKVSINAIMDLLPIVDAMIAFNQHEADIWNSFKRVYVIQKGIDLEMYKPKNIGKKLKGSPAILYAEHWRGFRHPLHILAAVEKCISRVPKLRCYLFGCPDADKDFWLRIVRYNHYSIFTPGVFGQQNYINELLNMSDVVISPVFPSYGRVALEAMACNKPVIAYDSNPHATYQTRPYDIYDMAEKIIRCCDERPGGQREYVLKNANAEIMAKQAIEIYQRFV